MLRQPTEKQLKARKKFGKRSKEVSHLLKKGYSRKESWTLTVYCKDSNEAKAHESIKRRVARMRARATKAKE